MKDKQERTTEELLKRVSESNKRVNIRKLDSDDQGRLLLDWSNPHDREWFFNDDAYEIIDKNRQSGEKY